MIDPSEQQYKSWQDKLGSSNLFRQWWRFWSNHAFVFFIPVFAWMGLQRNPYETIGLCAISFFSARVVVSTVINHIYHRVRPYQKYNFIPITSFFFSLQTDLPNSFPSRHMVAYTSIAFTVFSFFPIAGLILISVSILTGTARVILGFHYTTDIIGGLIIGAILGLLVAWAGPITLFT